MNGGFSSDSGHKTVIFKHTCFSSGVSSRLQAYHPSVIDISYAYFLLFATCKYKYCVFMMRMCRGQGWGLMIPAFPLLLFAEMLLFQEELKGAILTLREPLGLQLCLAYIVQKQRLKKTFFCLCCPFPPLQRSDMIYCLPWNHLPLTSKCHSTFGKPWCASRLHQLNIGK